MNEYEAQILQNARSYENSRRPMYESQDPRCSSWFRAIYDDYERNVLSRLTGTSERLIDYWPCYVLLEVTSTDSLVNGTHSVIHRGVFGSGYICITSDHVHIRTFASLSREYPPFPTGVKAFAYTMLRGALGEIVNHNFVALKENKTWTIPHRALSTSKLNQRYYPNVQVLDIPTKYGDFQVLILFPKDPPVVLTALNMASLGDYDALRKQPSRAGDSRPSQTDDLLEKLSDLRRSGVVTEIEYDVLKARIESKR